MADADRIGPRIDRGTPVVVTRELLDRLARVERAVASLNQGAATLSTPLDDALFQWLSRYAQQR